MRTEFSNVQETRPLLDTQKTTTTTTKSENNSTISKKFLLSVIFLLTVAIIIFALVLNQTGNVPRNKEFVFSNEWSSLETIDTKYIPKRWTFDSLCGDDESIELTFAVKQQNVDSIHDKIYEVSNPKSSTFGQHWTMEEIHELLKPKDDSIDMLISWFEYYNIDTNNINYLTLNKDFIRIETTIKIANEMLNTQYAYWVNEDGDKHIRVKEGYYVPSTISEHLDFVSPTLRFPPTRHTKTVEKIDVNAISSSSITYNTPSRIRSLYQMDDYINLAAYPGHFQAIATFLGEWFTDSDIELFWEFFEIDSADLTRVPSFQPTGYGDECDLDIEYITTTGSRIDTYIWDIEDDLYFISLIQQMLESGSPPSVVSMSYGGDEQSNGFVYCHRANVEFAKIGLYGTTVLASSGDSGVTGDSYQCTDEYYPSFPASSPYVIAVGGTTGGDISSSLDLSTGETAWVDSGGGFSWFFQRQSWQDDAIETYYSTATSLPSSTKFNGYGRGYPDLSAQSVDYIICMESEFWSVSGTSCSCPTVAGMISLVNDVRLQKGKSRLGWILPSLYSLLSEDSESYYFNDVTEGYNVGCADDNYVAFSAASYWDPVTGFGTIKYPRLFDALVDL